MGTRADFYIGRGEDAQWLGSTAWDGYPSGFDNPDGRPMLTASTGEQFRAAVTHLLASRNDATTPDRGWPWPWNDSRTTDYAYAFDGDGVYVSCFGHAWSRIDMDDENFGQPEEPEGGKVAVFPDMSERKNPRLAGPASGLMVIGFSAEGAARVLGEDDVQ